MQPQKHVGIFRYAGKEIIFNFWLSCPEKRPPDTIVFLGAGQVGIIPRWIANAAGRGIIVVEGLPHWESGANPSDLIKFCKAYVKTAFIAALRTFNVPSLNIIAESQAAPASIALAASMPAQIGNVVLVRPLGFSVAAYGKSEQARLRVFYRRILRTAMQPHQSLIHDPRNAWAAAIATRAMLREPSLSSLAKKYAVGISYDVLKTCRQVAKIQKEKGGLLAIILSEKDKLFPPNEVIAALDSFGIRDVRVEITPDTSHSSLAVRASKKVLRRAVVVARTCGASLPLLG